MNPARPSFVCASCARALRNQTKSHSIRPFSSTTTSKYPAPTPRDPESSEQLPRWKQTPAAMKMPIRLRPQPKQSVWKVNKDEEKLNQVYDRFIGAVGGRKNGRDLLDEETKWLAITHKSFDHGRQGFNDRLAYLGKRIVDLQCSLALLSMPSSPLHAPNPKHVYQHPALEGLDNVSVSNKMQVLDKTRLANLAGSYGLEEVVRWKPKKSDNLEGSGVDTVLAHTIYSIVGAVAMQRGGEIAAKMARERVLQPLGLR